MQVVKANSSKGKALLARASHYEGRWLNQVYTTWSAEKQKAFDRCEAACYSMHGTGFSVVSHNRFGFSVSWFTDKACYYCTPQTDYKILF